MPKRLCRERAERRKRDDEDESEDLEDPECFDPAESVLGGGLRVVCLRGGDLAKLSGREWELADL